MNKCLNVCTLYDNYEEVSNYINETLQSGSGNIDIALVKNKDTQKKANIFEREHVRVFDFNGNVGYLNSLLMVIKQIDLTLYKYVILSNTDIQYNTNKFFDVLLKKEYSDDIGCIAPSVYATKSKSYSNPHYIERVTKEKLERLYQIFSYPLLADLYMELASMKAGLSKKNKMPSCYVYSPHGCYMIFSNDFISKICGYIYGVKMYSEESCVGELLARENMKCLYDSDLEVIHNESAVTGKMGNINRFKMWKESISYIIQEFYK